MSTLSPNHECHRTFVGFGFGPIQAGLFLFEALRSGKFSRAVVAEVLPDVVTSVRGNGGRFEVNVASNDATRAYTLGPIEMENPRIPEDRKRLVAALQEASEISTAVPSVRFYRGDPAEASVHQLLAESFSERKPGAGPVVVYAAENDRRAAEILQAAVLDAVPSPQRDQVTANVRFVNTVVGKMSAVVENADDIQRTGLRTVTPDSGRAFLVETFHHILISSIDFSPDVGFQRGLDVFEEKNDLAPFETTKLFGHNAIHALAAYLAAREGFARMEELRQRPIIVSLLRDAFVNEAGAALCRRYAGADPLFTPERFALYVDDLLKRMMNPHLGDLVERVARDPVRKLGWNDRLVGSLRFALEQGVEPRRLALGAAAALTYHRPDLEQQPGADRAVAARGILHEIWEPACPEATLASRVSDWIERGLAELEAFGGREP